MCKFSIASFILFVCIGGLLFFSFFPRKLRVIITCNTAEIKTNIKEDTDGTKHAYPIFDLYRWISTQAYHLVLRTEIHAYIHCFLSVGRIKDCCFDVKEIALKGWPCIVCGKAKEAMCSIALHSTGAGRGIYRPNCEIRHICPTVRTNMAK